jgi:hypothetical protein
MYIIERILTVIVLGLAFGIWMLSLHLDELVTIIVDFFFVATVVLLFIFSGLLRKWF